MHESGHVIASHFLTSTEAAVEVTIVQDGKRLGLTTFSKKKDALWSVEDCNDKMVVFLGGYVVEMLFIKSISNASQEDLA